MILSTRGVFPLASSSLAARRVGLGLAGFAAWQPTARALNEPVPSASAAEVEDARQRLRRTTTSGLYTPGQQFSIQYVPQLVWGVDIGHISLAVTNNNGTQGTVGFYSKYYRSSGMNLLLRAPGVLVTPDPLYAKAMEDPALRRKVQTLWEGELTVEQAAMLNQWTNDTLGEYELSQFVSRAGRQLELAVTTVPGEHYAALPLLGDNCATWAERTFDRCITCPLKVPISCRARPPASG